MRYFRDVLYLAILFAILLTCGCSATSKPMLTGTELILELEFPTQPQKDGIYTWRPFKDKKPRLWLAGAHRPVWSRNRTVLAYEYKNTIRLQDVRQHKSRFICILNGSTRDFRKPLLEMNENQGVVFEHAIDTGVNIDLVSPWDLFVGDMKPLKQDLRYTNQRTPFLALTSSYAHFDQVDLSSNWKQIKLASSVSFEPGEKRVAVQEMHPAPWKAHNTANKIWIYNIRKREILGMDGKSLKKKDYYINLGEGGRRLTSFTNDVDETEPIWSPNGKWIAFSIYDPKKTRSDAVVCSPDGSNMHILTKSYSTKGPYPLADFQWAPLGTVSDTSGAPIPEPGRELGVNDARAVSWSDDGRFLLIVRGYSYSTYALARSIGKGWEITAWQGHFNRLDLEYTSSVKRIFFVRMRDEQWIAQWMENLTGDSINLSCIKTKKRVSLNLEENQHILWADW